MGKAAGRSGSEPRRSLVTYLEMPTLWSEGEGRCLREQNEHPPSGSSGVAGAACGGRDTVQDGRPAAVRAQNQQPRRIRETEIAKGRRGSRRGSSYRLRARDNTTPPEGRDPTLFTFSTSGGSGDCHGAINPEYDQDTPEETVSEGQV